MVGTPIKHAQMAVLRDVGEDNIFDDIATGMSVRKLVAKHGIGNRAFYHWLNDEPGRKARYRQAQERQARVLAEECIEIADATQDAAQAQVSKLRIDARKFMASKIDPERWGDQKGPLVNMNISVGGTHLNAIKDLANAPVVIDQEKDEE